MASDVSAYCPGPASLTAATRNSYGFPSTRPLTVTLLSGTNSPGVALDTKIATWLELVKPTALTIRCRWIKICKNCFQWSSCHCQQNRLNLTPLRKNLDQDFHQRILRSHTGLHLSNLNKGEWRGIKENRCQLGIGLKKVGPHITVSAGHPGEFTISVGGKNPQSPLPSKTALVTQPLIHIELINQESEYRLRPER